MRKSIVSILVLSLLTVFFLFQNFSSVSQVNQWGNGTTFSWDSGFVLITSHGEGVNGPFWKICPFIPKRVTTKPATARKYNYTQRFEGDGRWDHFTEVKDIENRDVLDFDSGSAFSSEMFRGDGNSHRCRALMMNKFTNDPYAWAPVGDSSSGFNYSVRSNFNVMNSLSIAPVNGDPLANPYISNAAGQADSNGTYLTYDFYLYSPNYLDGVRASNDFVSQVPNLSMGRMHFKMTLKSPKTEQVQIHKMEMVQDWHPISIGAYNAERVIDALEPTLTSDGHLMMFNANNLGGVIMYSFNENPAALTGWSRPKHLSELYYETAKIKGVNFKDRYPIARHMLRSNLGEVYSAGETIRGAYPWITWEGTDVFFMAGLHRNDSVRGAWSVVGDSTGGKLRAIDGGFREWVKDMRATDGGERQHGSHWNTSMLITNGVAHSSSIWNPFRELKNSPFPTNNQRPVILMHHSNRYEITEVSFKSYLDGHYLLHLPMNRALGKLTNGSTNHADHQYVSNQSADIANFKINYNGSLVGSYRVPQYTHDQSITEDFYGEHTRFGSYGFVESRISSSDWNQKQVTVEFMVKPLVSLSGNESILLAQASNNLKIRLGSDFKIKVSIDGKESNIVVNKQLNSLGSLQLGKWTHVAVTWAEASEELSVFLNAQKSSFVRLSGFSLLSPSDGRLMIGSLDSATINRGATEVVAIDEVKVSRIVRSADDFADSLFYSRKSRRQPANLGASAAIASEHFRVMGEKIDEPTVQLGSLIFRDPRISKNGKVSCGTCHMESKGFADGLIKSKGVAGVDLTFHTPTIFNRGTGFYQTWAGGFSSSAEQALGPVNNHLEMGMTTAEVIAKMNTMPGYKSQFQTVFGKEINPISIKQALGAFVNSIVTTQSRFDQYAAGQNSALTADEITGKNLFFGKARCVACHSGPNFSDEIAHNTGIFESLNFGLGAVSLRAQNRNKVKTPTLRNLSSSAPYFHNGSAATIEAVIELYNVGGANSHQTRDGEIKPLGLTASEKNSLKAFLKTLDSGTKFAYSVNMTAALPIQVTVPGVPILGNIQTSDTQLSVNFNAPTSNGGSAIKSYEVLAEPTSSGYSVVRGIGSQSPVTLSQFKLGVSYKIKVRAENEVGFGDYASSTLNYVFTAVPSAPSFYSVKAKNASVDAVLSAPANTGGANILKYEIQILLSSNGSLIKTVESTATSIAITGLTNGTSYKAKARAYNHKGASSWSADSAAFTPTAELPGYLPSSPLGISAVGGSSLADVTFQAPANLGNRPILEYEVQVFQAGQSSILKSVKGAQSPIKINELPNQQKYSFFVRARNEIGWGSLSERSNEVIVTDSSDSLIFRPGQLSLYIGQSRHSRAIGISMDSDGVLRVRSNVNNSILWQSTTSGQCSGNCLATFQGDGHLVFHRNQGPYFASGTIEARSELIVSQSSPYVRIRNLDFSIDLWSGTDLSSMPVFAKGQFMLTAPSYRDFKDVRVAMQQDGNFVIYNKQSQPIWASNSAGRSCIGCFVIFQGDGHFVLYEKGWKPYWVSETHLRGHTMQFSLTAPHLQIKDFANQFVYPKGMAPSLVGLPVPSPVVPVVGPVAPRAPASEAPPKKTLLPVKWGRFFEY